MNRNLLPIALFGLSTLSVSAVTIVSQGFETSGDTWTFGLDPNVTFDASGDTWAATAGLAGFSAVSGPQQGSQYWGGRDMDGGSPLITTSTRAWLVFDSIDVSAFENKTLTFYWSGQGNVDEIGYVVSTTTDGSSAVITPDTNLANTVTGGVTLAGSPGGAFLQDWTQVSINIDDNVTDVSLGLYGLSTGSTRYLAFDNVVLEGTTIPEPSTYVLSMAALVGLVALVRRRNR